MNPCRYISFSTKNEKVKPKQTHDNLKIKVFSNMYGISLCIHTDLIWVSFTTHQVIFKSFSVTGKQEKYREYLPVFIHNGCIIRNLTNMNPDT